MKVLIVNKKDISGGAARAAYRLHKGLQAIGVESSMLVMEKTSFDSSVHSVPSNILQKNKQLIDKFALKFYKPNKTDIFSPALTSLPVLRHIEKLNPDIVHLHWIPRGFMSIESIKKIQKPIVWTMHDMWPFTGGCHYAGKCMNYQTSCGKCPVLFSSQELDLSRKVILRKEKAFDKPQAMQFVGPSQWMSDCASKSYLLKGKEVTTLPNGIDTKTFKPGNKEHARKKLDLPIDKRIILFGAMDSNSDHRKGYEYLSKALNQLPDLNAELLVFGNNEKADPNQFKLKTHFVGTISDDERLSDLYSAADITIVPSLQENLSNIIMESMACGTPVLGFDIGGNSDMILHKQTGYLAKFSDPNDLSNGIQWVLKDDLTLHNLSENCRNYVLQEFEIKKVARDFVNLYHQLIS